MQIYGWLVMDKNELYYQTGRNTLAFQDTLHREFSDKAISLLGFAIAITAAGVIALNLGDGIIPTHNIYILVPGIALLAMWILGLIGVAAFSSAVMSPRRDWKHGTTSASLSRLVKDDNYDADYLYWCAADDFRESIEYNETVLEKKAMTIRKAVLCIGGETVGVICLVALFLLTEKPEVPALWCGL